VKTARRPSQRLNLALAQRFRSGRIPSLVSSLLLD
jgi:hypothetical protein